jgi:hypothetical protein
MYIDDKANLPWNNKARYASMYGRKYFFHEPLLWHPAPTYIPDRVWFCDKDKQVYH